jgi:hypothetical protein
VAFEQQVLGGLLLVAAGLGVLAVVQAERRGLAAAAVFLVGGGIYLAVVWRLQLRRGLERALAAAQPARDGEVVEARPVTALRSLAIATVVAAVAIGLGLLHLGGAGIVLQVGAGAVALLRAAQVARSERAGAVRVYRRPRSGAYVTRARTVEDTSLRVVAPPE